MKGAAVRRRRGFTLIELMLAVGLAGVLLTLAIPSFRDYIVTQRLKGVTAALVTDLQFARSESASRSRRVFVHFMTDSAGLQCYTIYVDKTDSADKCNCRLGPGAACGADQRELRTVQLAPADGVSLGLVDGQPASVSFDPVGGGVYVVPPEGDPDIPPPYTVVTGVDSTRKLNVRLNIGGTPMVCLPSGAQLSGGYPACSP